MTDVHIPIRADYRPEYWFVRVSFRIPGWTKPGPRSHHKFQYNRARANRRLWEAKASDLLQNIESITRFPAYVIAPKGDQGYFAPWSLIVQSYALSNDIAIRAREAIFHNFDLPVFVEVGTVQRDSHHADPS